MSFNLPNFLFFNRKLCLHSMRFATSLVAIAVLFMAVMDARAQPKDLTLYLDFSAATNCNGPCANTWRSAGSSYYYDFGSFDSNSTAQSRIIADYRWLDGYKGPITSSGEYLDCDAPTIQSGLTYEWGSKGWFNNVRFAHTCRYRFVDSSRPPGANINNVVLGEAPISGYCEAGFYAYANWPTGECGRSPNSCLKYPDNKAYGCGQTVAAIEAVLKNGDDPTRIFHQTQLCIARKSCDLRCRMDNCQWMEKVIPEFVNPYLQKAGKWPEIEQTCRDRGSGWFSDRICAEAMARNHIFNDLLPAVAKYGCGSDVDWESVYLSIEECSGMSLGNRLEQTVSSGVVWAYRNAVRTACQATRSLNQLPTDINLDLKGRICEQPQ